jgi:hypothetical protein
MEDPGVAAWSVSSGTLAKNTTDPAQGLRFMRLTQSGAPEAYVFQSVMTPGRTYRLTGFARGDGTATPVMNERPGGAGTAYNRLWTGDTNIVWYPFDFTWTARVADLQGSTWMGVATDHMDLDGLYLSEEPDVGNYLADGDCEAPNNQSWLGLGGAVTSKVTTTPYSGLRALRVTNGGGFAGRYCQVVGTNYRLYGYARGDGTSNPRIFNGGYRWTGTTSTSWQAFDITWVSANELVRFYCSGGGAGNYTEWDSVVLTVP